jgi:predicted transcriptional regulator
MSHKLVAENVIQREGLYGFEMKANDPDYRRARSISERKTYDIKQLWQRNHEIINLSLQGLTNTDIAKILGITREAVSATLNSELGVKKLSEMRKARDENAIELSKEINDLVEKALDTYHQIFDAPTDQCSLKLKKETADTVLLDLAGHRAPTKIDSRSVSVYATPEQISEFKKRGLEAARAAGLLVE